MTIFMIPFSGESQHKTDFLQPGFLVDELSKKHNIIGMEKIPYFGTSNALIKYFRLIIYTFNVLIFGLKQRKKYDVIYCVHPVFGLMGATISFFARKPCIWDTNEGNLLAHCRLLETSFVFTWIHLIIEKFIGGVASAIIVPSLKDKKLYLQQKFKYINKIDVIPYGIDLSFVEQFKMDKLTLRKKLNIPIEAKVLIYTGKREYLPNKEAAFWINDELAPRLAQKYDNVRIFILGSGDVPRHIHPMVNFTGFVPSVYEYIFASDLCIVPYLLNTGISLKVLDGMACSKAVITMTSVAELFSNLVYNGNIIIAEDREEFISKTIWALQNLEDVIRIGAGARKTVEEFYDLKSIARKIDQLFESCVNNKKLKVKQEING